MSQIGESLASMALKWESIKVPYVHRGTRRTGCDCTGLVIGCLQELGEIRHYKLRWYPRDWNLHAMGEKDDFLQQELVKVADEVRREPKVGDIILFRFGKCIAHCGIVVKCGMFVHAHAGARKVSVGLLRTPKWLSRLASVWELNPEKMRVFNG